MTKKQTRRKPNAAKMSRTALIAEVRQLRKLAKRQEELAEAWHATAKEQEAELDRRDKAREIYRKLEPAALAYALRHFDEWAQAGRPACDLPNDFGRELDKTARALFQDTYWQNIFMSYAQWFLEQIDKARADA